MFLMLIFLNLLQLVKIYCSYRGFFYSDEYKLYYKIIALVYIVYGILNGILDLGIFAGILKIVNLIGYEKD